MVYVGCELSKLSPMSMLSTTLKIVAHMFLKHTSFYDLRLVLKILSSKATLEIKVSPHALFRKRLSFLKLAQKLFGNLSFLSYLN